MSVRKTWIKVNRVSRPTFRPSTFLDTLYNEHYLNFEQTKVLRNAVQFAKSEQVKSQLNMNILCSYIFTTFIGLLIIFLIKSFL